MGRLCASQLPGCVLARQLGQRLCLTGLRQAFLRGLQARVSVNRRGFGGICNFGKAVAGGNGIVAQRGCDLCTVGFGLLQPGGQVADAGCIGHQGFGHFCCRLCLRQ